MLAPDLGVPGVAVRVTTRRGGVSSGPFSTLNLALHVGDAPASVAENRHRLERALSSRAVSWLQQIHGIDVCEGNACEVHTADAQWTCKQSLVLAVLTADCLPVVFAARDGSCVGVAHAGWRGLADGVLESLLKRFPAPREEIIAWLGPAIGREAYEVGPEVRRTFLNCMGATGESGFQASRRTQGHWMADLSFLAKQRLVDAGVAAVLGGDGCTYRDAATFFSHRRDGPSTGRMATLVWREPR